jgi:hypothetical protein
MPLQNLPLGSFAQIVAKDFHGAVAEMQRIFIVAFDIQKELLPAVDRQFRTIDPLTALREE